MKRNYALVFVLWGLSLGIVALLISNQAFAQGGTWTTLAPMPTPTNQNTEATVNGLLYVISGANTSIVQVYNPGTNSWTTAAPIPTNRGLAASGVINGKIYVVGGCINSDCRVGVTNVNEQYDPASNTWTEMAPMLSPRVGMAVGVVNGKLYVAGGYNFCAPCGLPISTMEVYDPVTNTWSTKAMPTPVGYPGAGVINGQLYVVGGSPDNTVTTIFGMLQAYDPTTDTWTTRASMPTVRFALGVGVVNGILYAVSGIDATHNFTTAVEAYNPASDTWTTVAPIPNPRYEPWPVAINGVLYVAGNDGLGDLAAFTPSTPTAQNWTHLSPTGGPPPARLLHTAVYDPATNIMIVFGGENHTGGAGGPCVGTTCYNDVWVLSNADGLGGTPVWTQLTPSGATPLPRFSPTAVYDRGSNNMVMYGGGSDASPPYFGGCTGQFDETWVLSDANGSGGTPTWTQLSPVGAPPIPRQSHAAVYDRSSNRMIIFGGAGDCGFLADLWVLSDANGSGGTPTWTQLSPLGPAPSNRGDLAAVYDTANNRMIIFGGAGTPTVVPPGDGQCCFEVFNEVWVLSNANGLGGDPIWAQLAPTGGPPSARAGATAIYDPATNTMTIVGGNGIKGDLVGDVWQLSNANGLGGAPTWTQLIPSSIPGLRSGHTATFSQATGRMTIFGGSQTSDPALGAIGSNDTWVLTEAAGIVQAETSVALSSSANPSVFGQGVTLTATVTPTSGSGTPTGTVTFQDGTTTIGAQTLSGGQAMLTLSNLSVGLHSITAVYGGDTNFTASASPVFSQVVNKASTNTAATSSANPSLLNQSVTFTATVAVVPPGAGTPTGTVTFMDGATTLASVGLSPSGQATFSTSALTVSAHSIAAVYSGDDNFSGSSNSVTQTVAYGICVLYDQTRSVKSGAVFPIKLYLCDVNGNDVSSPGIVLHATQITGVSGFSGDVDSPGNANPDNDFRFDSTQGPAGGYIFNLSTAGLGSGTYSLHFTATGDPVDHTVMFGVR